VTRFDRWAFWLLVLGAALQFAWRVAWNEAQAWNASQALLIMVLLAGWALAFRARWMLRTCALLGAWQLMTFGCSVAYLIRPWHNKPGQGQCSTALDLPLGAIGGCVALFMAWRIYLEAQSNGH
jgi:hypothetical protein